MNSELPQPTREVRGRYRPPIGIPLRGEPRAQATVAAVLVHALVILLVLVPTLIVTAATTDLRPLGAGGPGPTGGGGGGNLGTGGSTVRFVPERLRFVRVAPVPEQKVTPPEKPKPPELKPPEPKKPDPQPTPVVEPKAAAAASDSSLVKGTGGGSGNDGTAGSGPGSGGGVGSGVGTGRGSGSGPGTGGGGDAVYPPTVVALPILPLPIPSKVRPYRMVAEFEVDSTGVARLLTFNPSRDAGYNRRIREMLLEIRFRPAVRVDGRPVKALAVVTAEAM